MNKPMWLCMVIKLMSIHFYGYVYLVHVLFRYCQYQSKILVKRRYVCWDKSYISSLFIYLDYIFVLLSSMSSKHDHVYRQKDIFSIFLWFKSIHIKSVHSGPKIKATISKDMYCVRGLYFKSSCMWKFFTYFEDRKVLESVGIIPLQDSLDWVESQMESNTIYYL